MANNSSVVASVLAQFGALPKTGKPQPHEHTVLAGIALSLPDAGVGTGRHDGGSGLAAEQGPCPQQQELAVVAIGTGTKCLGASKRLPGGGAVNDCHAEVLSRRALLRWLYLEMRQVVERFRQLIQQAPGPLEVPAAAAAAATRVLRLVPPPDSGGIVGDVFGGWRFELQAGVGLHLYVSQPPCGDASILNLPAPPATQQRQDPAPDQQQHEEEIPAGSCNHQTSSFGRTGAKALNREQGQLSAVPSGHLQLPNHGHCEGNLGLSNPHQQQQKPEQPKQHEAEERQWLLPQQHEVESYAQAQAVCVVRRKPGRGDATLSMACSDKLARWCLLGLQGALLGGLLTAPLHLSTVTVGLQANEPAGSAEAWPVTCGTNAGEAGDTIEPAAEQQAQAQQASSSRAAAGAAVEQQAPDSSTAAAAAELALRRALLDRTAQLASERLPPGSLHSPPSVHIHAPDIGSNNIGSSSDETWAHALGLAPSATRRVAGGSSVVWIAPPSTALKWKRQEGGAVAAVLCGGTSEAVIGGSGLRVGSARVDAGLAVPASSQPSVCKAALFAQWLDLAAMLRRLPQPRAVETAPEAAAQSSASCGQTQHSPPELRSMQYRQAKRTSSPQYIAAWQHLLQPPSPFDGWIPKPPLLEDFALALR